MKRRIPSHAQALEVLAALKDPLRAARKGDGETVCRSFSALLDHTLLRPDTTAEDVRRVCREGAQWRFAAVVVNPCYVRMAAELLAGAGVAVASVAGFPSGASRPETKKYEAERALADGAAEVDMVMAIGALRGGETSLVEADLRGVAEVCHSRGAILKVILECALLNTEQKRLAAKLAVQAGAYFVKTSTGFGPGGATAEDVALLRATVGPEIGVKAAGGIRTLADTAKMLAAGASRIGTSSGPAIMEAFQNRLRT